MYEMNNNRRTRAYNYVNRQLGIEHEGQTKLVDYLTTKQILNYYSMQETLRNSYDLKRSVRNQYEKKAYKQMHLP